MRIFLLILFLGLVFPSFIYQGNVVKVYADLQGNAHVIEEVKLLIDSDESAAKYDAGMTITNDLTSWRDRTGIDNIVYHVNPEKVAIQNLRITPLPRRRLSLINPSYEAKLKIEYDAIGMFNVNESRPRTLVYTLKDDALLFKRTKEGEIVLEEDESFVFIPPKGSRVLNVEPLPPDLDAFDPNLEEYRWYGKTILEDFVIRYEYEKSLKDEVIEYFDSVRESFLRFLNSVEFVYVIAGALIVYATYVLLTSRLKVVE